MPSRASGRSAFRAWWRAAAMVVTPASRSAPMAALRMVAMTSGPVPGPVLVRIWDRSSRASKRVISLVVLPTSILADTTPMAWSAAARTCRAAAVRVREPRNVLPSNAIACRDPGAGGGARVASHLPITAASRSGSSSEPVMPAPLPPARARLHQSAQSRHQLRPCRGPGCEPAQATTNRELLEAEIQDRDQRVVQCRPTDTNWNPTTQIAGSDAPSPPKPPERLSFLVEIYLSSRDSTIRDSIPDRVRAFCNWSLTSS